MTTKTTRSLLMALTLALPLAAAAPPARACPACKDTVAGGDTSTSDPAEPGVASTGGVAGGFNASVYLMLGAFIGTLGLIGFTLVRGARDGTLPMPPDVDAK